MYLNICVIFRLYYYYYSHWWINLKYVYRIFISFVPVKKESVQRHCTYYSYTVDLDYVTLESK
jgi:hypothetical protein